MSHDPKSEKPFPTSDHFCWGKRSKETGVTSGSDSQPFESCILLMLLTLLTATDHFTKCLTPPQQKQSFSFSNKSIFTIMYIFSVQQFLMEGPIFMLAYPTHQPSSLINVTSTARMINTSGRVVG
jgi:hypothetical protein